jgi:hypothetical protein
MLAYTATQLVDAAQYVDVSAVNASVFDLAQDDPATWWEKIKDFAAKALIGLLIFIAIIFLLGTFFGFWLGKKWGRRSAVNDMEERAEAAGRAVDRQDVDRPQ